MDEYKDRGLTLRNFVLGWYFFCIFFQSRPRQDFSFGRHKWKTRKEAVKESCDQNYESIIPNVSGTAITTIFYIYIYIYPLIIKM